MLKEDGLENMHGVGTGWRVLLSGAGGIEKNLRIYEVNRKIFYDNQLSPHPADSYHGSAYFQNEFIF